VGQQRLLLIGGAFDILFAMNIETEIAPELWAAVRRSYESQAWSNAILDGIYHLSDVIRSRSGLQSDGVVLAGQALGGKMPKLRLNKLQTESDKNIQSGAEQLLRGLYQAIRNPRSHDRVNDSQKEADALLVFIDFLLGLIGHAKTAFSLDEAVSRALDEDFVPNERYAALVIEDIPPRERLHVALAAFERRGVTDHSRLAYFFQAALQRFSPEERTDFFTAISEELRDSSDNDALRTVLQILRPEQWTELTEVARLRSENRLLRDFRNGKYNLEKERCSGGALATWSTKFWPHFALKTEFLNVAAEQIASKSAETYEYVRRFALHSLDSLAAEPPWPLQNALRNRIKARDENVYFLVKYGLWSAAAWNKAIKDAIAEYEASEESTVTVEPEIFAEPAESMEDDDIPF
jgi:uncharacterized protein (TIGR02391 family)